MPSEKASGGPRGHPGCTGARRRENPQRDDEVTPHAGWDRVVTDTARGGSPDAATTLRSALSVITTVGAPLTIITALMLYFGWARSNAQSNWMGIEVSLFHFSAQDYVLRGVRTVRASAGRLRRRHRVAGNSPSNLRRGRPRQGESDGTRSGHDHHVRRHRHRHHQRGARIDEAGVATGTGGLPRYYSPPERHSAHTVAGSSASAADRRRRGAPCRTGRASYRSLLVGVVIALAVFWAVGQYAGIVGRGIGQEIEQKVGALPRATAISETPLGIDAPNVATKAITVGAQTLYSTTGLRLLGESGGRLFLLNDGWSRRSGSIIVLDANKSVRWQFGR